MTRPTNIRCAWTADGDIEAACPYSSGSYAYVVIDPRTGSLKRTSMPEGSDMFRWLIREARAAMPVTDYRIPSNPQSNGE